MYYNTGSNALLYWNGTAWVGAVSDATKVDKDSVVVAATRIVASKLLAGDAQPAFKINGDGTISWGPGGSVATDTSLYRNSANSLWTSSEFVIYNNTLRVLGANSGALLTSAEVGAGHYDFVLGINGSMSWGTATAASDTNLYRIGAGVLNTDGALQAGKYVFAGSATGAGNWAFLARVSGDSNNRWDVVNNGIMEWGTGAATPDTRLYRYTPGGLTLDGNGIAGNWPYLLLKASGAAGDGTGIALHSSPAGGTNADWDIWNEVGDDALYFQQHNGPGNVAILRSTGLEFNAGGTDAYPSLLINRSDGKHYWGPGGSTPLDTSLYRWFANALYTPGTMGSGAEFRAYHASVGTAFEADLGGDAWGPRFYFDTNGRMNWGTGAVATDTILYRNGAGFLATGGTFQAAAQVVVNTGGANQVNIGWSAGAAAGLELGSAGDTRIYRSAAGVLKTDGTLRAVNDIYAQDGAAYQIRIGNSSATPAIEFGSAFDTRIYRSAAGVLTTSGILNAIGGLQINGVPVSSGMSAYNNVAPADPVYTTSTSAVMVGLAFRITPTKTGRILVIASCRVANVTNTNLFLQLAVGTGTAPANGAAWPPAGTIGPFNNAWQANQGDPTLIGTYAGTVGTNYWLDLIHYVDTGSTYGGNAPRSINLFVMEI
jgi:hypothetical protein